MCHTGSMHAIYLITGIMASGKSTVAELLARRFARGVHLRGDAFRRMVVSGREDMTLPPSNEALAQLNLRYTLAASAAQAYHAAGFTVAWQDVMVGTVLPEVIARVTARPLYCIVLCPDPTSVAAREAERAKTGYGGGFTPENFHALLLNETPRIGLWIDSTHLTPEETVNVILQRTAEGEGLIE